MRRKKLISLLGFTFLISISLAFFYVLPTARMFYSGLQAYETRVAYRDDYSLHTTPLPKTVVDDICSKLNIKATSENCKSGTVVYAPELFDEIKTYFRNLPEQNKTENMVQEKLGAYLDYCERPDPSGGYVCHYDLRGDAIYPIAFFFDKDGTYYRIIANIGGS